MIEGGGRRCPAELNGFSGPSGGYDGSVAPVLSDLQGSQGCAAA